MEDNLGTLNCIKLKLELSKRGAKTTGTKAVLVERLRAYDRNQACKPVSQTVLNVF